MELTTVKFRINNAVHLIRTEGILALAGTNVIAETEHGIDIGVVLNSVVKNGIDEKEIKGKLLRVATEEDTSKVPEIEELEKKAFGVCRDKHKEKKLDMKLVNVKCLFDRTKIIFYFVAENRIDFRELVRDLASVFRTRIEMRQIGVRDESRQIGGYGSCGRTLCCMHMSGEFAPVSIKMAKEQNLNLNSLKISGICGRLLCCLSYEYQTYAELNVGLPEAGSDLTVGNRNYHVQSIDTLAQAIRFNYEGRIIEVKKDDIVVENGKYSITPEVIDRITHQEEHDPFDDED
ncbi:MAG TPA: regulatory iron-sulfur-containing complex subunit RicT [Spirochaetota bacterium]|nr:regulatory iron-sulfur-containing complex subunit RicT [Spirochaetota bacterium]